MNMFEHSKSACIVGLVVSALLYAGPAPAAQGHEVLLGADERFQISESSYWRFEVLREQSGRFADVRVKPQQGEDFSLTLYFIADPPELGRLDTPQKIAASVSSAVEKFLPQTVEKQVSLRSVSPRGSYGSIAVLTAANLQGLPGEFKYQTRGMVRLSPQAALGFSLLSKEVNTTGYTRLLTYVYSFVRLRSGAATSAASAASASTAAVVPARSAAAASSATAVPVQAPAPTPVPRPAAAPVEKAAPAAKPATPAQRAPQRDLRACLRLENNDEIMRCVNGQR
jgi:hypothetical protein